jgi:hypothetical protein
VHERFVPDTAFSYSISEKFAQYIAYSNSVNENFFRNAPYSSSVNENFCEMVDMAGRVFGTINSELTSTEFV